jgi:hypothetical protein
MVAHVAMTISDNRAFDPQMIEERSKVVGKQVPRERLRVHGSTAPSKIRQQQAMSHRERPNPKRGRPVIGKASVRKEDRTALSRIDREEPRPAALEPDLARGCLQPHPGVA